MEALFLQQDTHISYAGRKASIRRLQSHFFIFQVSFYSVPTIKFRDSGMLSDTSGVSSYPVSVPFE